MKKKNTITQTQLLSELATLAKKPQSLHETAKAVNPEVAYGLYKRHEALRDRRFLSSQALLLVILIALFEFRPSINSLFVEVVFLGTAAMSLYILVAAHLGMKKVEDDDLWGPNTPKLGLWWEKERTGILHMKIQGVFQFKQSFFNVLLGGVTQQQSADDVKYDHWKGCTSAVKTRAISIMRAHCEHLSKWIPQQRALGNSAAADVAQEEAQSLLKLLNIDWGLDKNETPFVLKKQESTVVELR